MTDVMHVNGNGHDAERERIDELAQMFRDAMNEFIRDERPKTWGRVLVYMCTLATYLQRTKRLELEQRIEALEARAENFKFAGQWQPGQTYTRGSVVAVPASGLYYCERDTQAHPSAGGGSWVLLVKSGRDGKDGAAAPAEPPQQRTTRSHR